MPFYSALYIYSEYREKGETVESKILSDISSAKPRAQKLILHFQIGKNNFELSRQTVVVSYEIKMLVKISVKKKFTFCCEFVSLLQQQIIRSRQKIDPNNKIRHWRKAL